jgi:hypothetical protein
VWALRLGVAVDLIRASKNLADLVEGCRSHRWCSSPCRDAAEFLCHEFNLAIPAWSPHCQIAPGLPQAELLFESRYLITL